MIAASHKTNDALRNQVTDGTRTMTQQFGKHLFDQAGKLFKDAVVQKNFQALSENAVAASKGLYDHATAAGLEQTKMLTGIADTAWGSTKMLNEKLAQNVISNIEATFAAAQLMAGAKSLPEIAKLQREFVQKFAAQSNSADNGALRPLDTRTPARARNGPGPQREAFNCLIGPCLGDHFLV